MSMREIWVDGDKIPEGALKELYRHPPDAPQRFDRSSIIIGPRGVGKTMFLRYQKKTHPGIALYFSLAADFGSITQESGKGPLGIEDSENSGSLLAGKAVSLLAVAMVEKLRAERIRPRHDLLRGCLPPSLQKGVNSNLLDNVGVLRAQVMATPLEQFGGLDESRGLYEFVSALGSAARKSEQSLLLLFDKADMVAGAALRPALSLLDQAGEFVALMALRPGQSSYTLTRFAETAVGGDHYKLVYLGLRPRSATWISFVEEAVKAQLGRHFDLISPEIRGHVITLARDSVRNALEILTQYLRAPRDQREHELSVALEDYHHNQVDSAQVMLKLYGWDFRTFVKQVRKDVVEQNGSVSQPIYVNVGSLKSADTLFGTSSVEFDSALQVALRMGAIAMPEGERWTPGLPLLAFELPPIVAWQPGDPPWQVALGQEPVEVSKTERQMMNSSRGYKASVPSMFIAYRFGVRESKEFRRNIAQHISAHRELAHWLVVDGNLPVGTPDWAKAIRERIKGSKIMIADVTGLRREIMFELGVAYGLNKLVIPVLAEPTDINHLPSWLSRGQLGSYDSVAALNQIVSSVLTLLGDPSYYVGTAPKKPVPPLAVWLRNPSDSDDLIDRFETVAREESLKSEILSPEMPEDHLIGRATSAGLLIISLDGTERDKLAHYICGAIVAKPMSSFSRRVLVIEREPESAAVSMRRCSGTVQFVRDDDVRRRVLEYARAYSRWAQAKPGRDRPRRGGR